MSEGRRSSTTSYAPTHKQFASGADQDLVAASPDQASCCRSIMLLAAGTFTKLKDARGIDNPISVSMAVGTIIEGDYTVANCSAAFIAFYGKPTRGVV